MAAQIQVLLSVYEAKLSNLKLKTRPKQQLASRYRTPRLHIGWLQAWKNGAWAGWLGGAVRAVWAVWAV
jgi:hypothetical protein